jgi:hypothetical protein
MVTLVLCQRFLEGLFGACRVRLLVSAILSTYKNSAQDRLYIYLNFGPPDEVLVNKRYVCCPTSIKQISFRAPVTTGAIRVYTTNPKSGICHHTPS